MTHLSLEVRNDALVLLDVLVRTPVSLSVWGGCLCGWVGAYSRVTV
jgi:hypothetical protein